MGRLGLWGWRRGWRLASSKASDQRKPAGSTKRNDNVTRHRRFKDISAGEVEMIFFGDEQQAT